MSDPPESYCPVLEDRCNQFATLPSEFGLYHCRECWCHECKTNAHVDDHDTLCGICQDRSPPGNAGDFQEEERKNPRFVNQGEGRSVISGPYDSMTRRESNIMKMREFAEERVLVARQETEAELGRDSVVTKATYEAYIEPDAVFQPLKRDNLTRQATQVLRESQLIEPEDTVADGSDTAAVEDYSGSGQRNDCLAVGPRKR